VSVLKDINVNVVSAEIDTFGDEARDELFITYHGEPLPGPMVQLVTNALQVGRWGGGGWGLAAANI
jgi:UTP:GlnB (protein PII) uridylyltransferase